MATRESRLAQFSQGIPKENRPLQILCEDQSGTYIVPYPCEWSEGAWRKVGSAKHIEATVIGWRVAPLSAMTLGKVLAAIPVLISDPCAVASPTG